MDVTKMIYEDLQDMIRSYDDSDDETAIVRQAEIMLGTINVSMAQEVPDVMAFAIYPFVKFSDNCIMIREALKNDTLPSWGDIKPFIKVREEVRPIIEGCKIQNEDMVVRCLVANFMAKENTNE